MLVQHHLTLLTLCWIMLEDVGLSLNLLKIFVQHRATLFAQQCCAMLASFEETFSYCSSIEWIRSFTIILPAGNISRSLFKAHACRMASYRSRM